MKLLALLSLAALPCFIACSGAAKAGDTGADTTIAVTNTADLPAPSSLDDAADDGVTPLYLTCPADTIALLRASAASVFDNYKAFTLDSIYMSDPDVNARLVNLYGDTIAPIAAMWFAHSKMTDDNASNLNAALIWHTATRDVIDTFLSNGHGYVSPNARARLLDVARQITYAYSDMSQFDINNAAQLRTVIAQYPLLDAYVALIDRFPESDIVTLVHADYNYLITEHYKYRDRLCADGYYSDLPRQLGEAMAAMFTAKATAIRNLLTSSSATIDDARRNLSRHIVKYPGHQPMTFAAGAAPQ
ncbi:MAG: hypothetical protein ACI30W_05395 [Muribaculaceae bacterium]